MSRKTVSAVIGSFLVAGFALGAVQGCGSSSSSTDPTALCEQVCTKGEMCAVDASATTAMAGCMTTCTSSTGSQNPSKCTNSSQIESAYSNCLKMSDCTQFEACVLAAPKCASGTGGTSGTGTGGTTSTGGTSGTGTAGTNGGGGAKGTGGAGGSAATATCATCTKAATCCTAAGLPSTTCSQIPTAAACNAATASTQTTDIQECQQGLAAGALLAPTASACQ